ncbi:hypothetical protein [Photorhabdus khanii]|uniref:hypothetical protein n=1 Tax=Photorhabdus khanii TaxID=1004150 RepID=UPI0004ADBE3E|nr:hypothetical protein [Photorhabdus khanii]
MDKRNTPVIRATSYLLIYLTAVYPLHPAIAAGILNAGQQVTLSAGHDIDMSRPPHVRKPVACRRFSGIHHPNHCG